MEFIRKRKRDLILLAALLLILLVSTVLLLCRHFTENADGGLMVSVQSGSQLILEVPLSEDGWYVIENGVAEKAEADLTLASLGEEAAPSKNWVNILEIKDGSLRMTESNCDNQVCVQTGSLTDASHDFPIVCLPHGLIITIEEPEGGEG